MTKKSPDHASVQSGDLIIIYSYLENILQSRKLCVYATAAKPAKNHQIVPITNVREVNSVITASPMLITSITTVEGRCAALKNSAFLTE